MDITYIILGILFLIIFALWWVFESGVFVDSMEDYFNDKEKPFDKNRKKF